MESSIRQPDELNDFTTVFSLRWESLNIQFSEEYEFEAWSRSAFSPVTEGSGRTWQIETWQIDPLFLGQFAFEPLSVIGNMMLRRAVHTKCWFSHTPK